MIIIHQKVRIEASVALWGRHITANIAGGVLVTPGRSRLATFMHTLSPELKKEVQSILVILISHLEIKRSQGEKIRRGEEANSLPQLL